MSTKYKIILVLYFAVALFIIYAGGLIVFLIYALFAAVGAAIGWMTTKEGSYENPDDIMDYDKPLFRVPVRLQSQASASDTIENYELKPFDEHNENRESSENDKHVDSTNNTDMDSHAIIDSSENNDSNGKE